jgi:hypothetical protein
MRPAARPPFAAFLASLMAGCSWSWLQCPDGLGTGCTMVGVRLFTKVAFTLVDERGRRFTFTSDPATQALIDQASMLTGLPEVPVPVPKPQRPDRVAERPRPPVPVAKPRRERG